MQRYSINIKGRLYEYTRPAVMGILNITPDSFYAGSQVRDVDEIRRRTLEMIADGADIIDVGAYSTRPGHQDVSEAEETERLRLGLEAVREVAPDIPVSVDTFRATVARRAITEMGADIINDVSGGEADPRIIDVAAGEHAPYILTCARSAQGGDFMAGLLESAARKVAELQLKGVCDIIIDPGFGFGKSLEENYETLRHLRAFAALHLPVLVGVSRKSMITKPLGITASEALAGTAVIHTIALQQGASILRVHDVKAARQAVTLVSIARGEADAG